MKLFLLALSTTMLFLISALTIQDRALNITQDSSISLAKINGIKKEIENLKKEIEEASWYNKYTIAPKNGRQIVDLALEMADITSNVQPSYLSKIDTIKKNILDLKKEVEDASWYNKPTIGRENGYKIIAFVDEIFSLCSTQIK